MSMVEEIRKEIERISLINKERERTKKESERIKSQHNKTIKFRDENFLDKYYYDQSDLPYFLPERTQPPDELTEEEQMNRLEDRKKKSTKAKSKRKIKKCRCK
jgi:hypothetical protein